MRYLKPIKSEDAACADTVDIKPCEVGAGMNFFTLSIPCDKDLEGSLSDFLCRCGYEDENCFAFLPSEAYEGEWILELEPEIIESFHLLKGPFSDVPPSSGLPYLQPRFQYILSLFLFAQTHLNAQEDIYLQYNENWMDESVLCALDELLCKEHPSSFGWYLVE